MSTRSSVTALSFPVQASRMMCALLLTIAGGTTAAPDLVEVQTPGEETIHCANANAAERRAPEWRVSTSRGALHFEPLRDSPRPRRDTLPFPYEAPGDRYVLAVENGFLVGWNNGEFGGGLDLVDRGGQRIAHLSGQNVHGIFKTAETEVVVVQGLNHLGLRDGVVRWFVQQSPSQWKSVAERKLSSGPEVATESSNVVYVLTGDSLARIDRKRQVRVLAAIETLFLYPNSMVVHRGVLWAGMRYFVVKMEPSPSVAKVTWLAPAGNSPTTPLGQCGERAIQR